MCGIAGYVSLAPAALPESVLRRMTGAIAHRGPDDEGFYRDEFAALGQRRLSIIDLAQGHQPMTSEAGALWITYNGEIFNHADLRPELERAGHRYQTRCDTETILHAYEQWGAACVTRFRGMFAFALWDKTSRTLFCARDRLGIKPFYYFWDGRLFAFASEIKALLEHPSITARLDESQLGEQLAFGYSNSEATLFDGIRKLMPGHRLTLAAGQLQIEPYWDVRAAAGADFGSDEAWIRACRERLETAVETRLMSDVPLGMFLSGGVDSSAIAALMKRLTTAPVKSFSVGYREAASSELDWARRVATRIGTEHREVVVGMEEFFEALPRLVWHEDEPIAWPSSVALHFVSRLAASEVKVVLTGEGSDELFGGYGRYGFYLRNQRWMRVWGMAPRALRDGVRSAVAGSTLLSAALRRKLGHTVLGRDGSLASLYLDNFYAAFAPAEQRRLARGNWPHADPYATYGRYWSAAPGGSDLARMLYADQKTYLVELLMKQDQMSMASSIESRVPFLDHPFVEFAAAVPDRLKIRGGVGKYILKQAVADLLPADIVHRPKMGFPTPIAAWLLDARAEPLYALLRDPGGLLAGFLDQTALDTLLNRHRCGVEDATDRIWRLLNLQIWGDLFITGRRAEPLYKLSSSIV